MLLRPPSTTRTDTLFPYPTLFRSHPLLRYVCQEGEIVKDGTHLQVLVATLREGDAAIRFGRAKRAAYGDRNLRPAIQAVLRQRHEQQQRLDVTRPVEASGNWLLRRQLDGTVHRHPQRRIGGEAGGRDLGAAELAFCGHAPLLPLCRGVELQRRHILAVARSQVRGGEAGGAARR